MPRMWRWRVEQQALITLRAQALPTPVSSAIGAGEVAKIPEFKVHAVRQPHDVNSPAILVDLHVSSLTVLTATPRSRNELRPTILSKRSHEG